MKFLTKAAEEAKKLPKAAWIAAVIVPGGFAAIGIYVAVRSITKRQEDKPLTEILKDWKKDD
jgi:hypothetical protein